MVRRKGQNSFERRRQDRGQRSSRYSDKAPEDDRYVNTGRMSGGSISGSVFSALVLMVFIFSLAVVLTLNFKCLYYMDVTTLGLDQQSSMTAAQIRQNYDALVRYNQLWQRGALVFPTLPMSDHGAIHFAQVKQIFDSIQIVCIASGILTLIIVIRAARRRQYRLFQLAGVFTLVIPAVLGILAAANWNRFFVGFHRMVFQNDYWIFDPVTDPVILILPETFFMHCAFLILALIFIAALCCLHIWRKKRRSCQ